MAVVPDPEYGSKTKSPGLVYNSNCLTISPTGFWVGWNRDGFCGANSHIFALSLKLVHAYSAIAIVKLSDIVNFFQTLKHRVGGNPK